MPHLGTGGEDAAAQLVRTARERNRRRRRTVEMKKKVGAPYPPVGEGAGPEGAGPLEG